MESFPSVIADSAATETNANGQASFGNGGGGQDGIAAVIDGDVTTRDRSASLSAKGLVDVEQMLAKLKNERSAQQRETRDSQSDYDDDEEALIASPRQDGDNEVTG